MKRNTRHAVRSHMQEREWLLKLGHGNLVNGVQQLLREAERERRRGGYYYSRRRSRRR